MDSAEQVGDQLGCAVGLAQCRVAQVGRASLVISSAVCELRARLVRRAWSLCSWPSQPPGADWCLCTSVRVRLERSGRSGRAWSASLRASVRVIGLGPAGVTAEGDPRVLRVGQVCCRSLFLTCFLFCSVIPRPTPRRRVRHPLAGPP